MADTIKFPPRDQSSLKNNILSGITLGAWIKLLLRRGCGVEWKTYWLRLIFITVLATVNSLIGFVEWIFYHKAISEAKVNQRPVFILGHPRTGTTLLHNMLSLDTELFSYSSTFQVGFPSTFLVMERFKSLLSGVIDDRRPMDNMPLSFDVPQEDELATNVLSGGVSPYMPLVFMRQEPSFRPYFTFEKASKSDLAVWTDSFFYFLKKLTVRFGSARRLLLKSPVHTARVKLLLQLFPDAQFIYIHRNPYVVFQSAVNMADKCYWYSYLDTPSSAQILDFILTQYDVLFEEYVAARSLIPSGSLIELAFNDLEANPAATILSLYKRFGWPHSAATEARLRAHETSIEGFKKNDHVTLTPAVREMVAKRWARSFAEFGYEL